MNRTIVILHLFLSMSMAKPNDMNHTALIENEDYKTDQLEPRSPEGIGDAISALLIKDDVLTTSDLTKIYNLIETKLAKTRSLKEEPENDGFKKVELKQLSRSVEPKSFEKSGEVVERSYSTDIGMELETKAAKRDSETEEKRSTSDVLIDIEPKHGVNEESKSDISNERTTKAIKEEKHGVSKEVEVESKDGNKELNMPAEENSVMNEFKSTTWTSKSDDYSPEYLENGGENFKDVLIENSGRRGYEDDNVDVADKSATKSYEINNIYKITTTDLPIEISDKKGFEVANNDESNTAWDLLDDIPFSRRMLSRPNNFNVETNPKATEDTVESLEDRKPAESNAIISRNKNLYVPSTNYVTSTPEYHTTSPNQEKQRTLNPHFQNTLPEPLYGSKVSIPHIHASVVPVRRFIIPGFIKIKPAKTIDYRRLFSQERNNAMKQYNMPEEAMRNHENVDYEAEDKSETIESKHAFADLNLAESSNSYPYISSELEKLRMAPKASMNPVFSKLLEASQHPQRFKPNFIGGNIQNPSLIGGSMGDPYSNRIIRSYNYDVAHNFGNYKYVNSFRQ